MSSQVPDTKHSITLDAKPGAIALETARTAVIVIDMQNDFAATGGVFERSGVDISMIQRAVAPTARVLAAARKAGIKVVYVNMGFQPDLSDLGAPESPNRVRHLMFGVGANVTAPDGTASRCLIRNTWNTAVVSELRPEPGEKVIYKHRFSGFYETELDAVLMNFGIKSLIVTGCTTSVCVESTVRDAMFRDYRCVLLADCMGEPIGNDFPRSNHEASLLVMQTLFGWVSDSASLKRALELQAISTAHQHA